MLSDDGPPDGVLQTTVRSLTPRSASASRQSVGHACGGPKLWTSSVAPSWTSETASSAVSQRRVVGMAGAHPTIARGRARRDAADPIRQRRAQRVNPLEADLSGYGSCFLSAGTGKIASTSELYSVR